MQMREGATSAGGEVRVSQSQMMKKTMMKNDGGAVSGEGRTSQAFCAIFMLIAVIHVSTRTKARRELRSITSVPSDSVRRRRCFEVQDGLIVHDAER